MRLIDADEIIKALSIFNDTENGNSHFINGIKTAKELIEDAPTVITDSDLDETEQRILRKFRELREKGRKNQYIHNPIAWALYWTWKDLELWSNVLDVEGNKQ